MATRTRKSQSTAEVKAELEGLRKQADAQAAAQAPSARAIKTQEQLTACVEWLRAHPGPQHGRHIIDGALAPEVPSKADYSRLYNAMKGDVERFTHRPNDLTAAFALVA
jgi:hypothetical protein